MDASNSVLVVIDCPLYVCRRIGSIDDSRARVKERITLAILVLIPSILRELVGYEQQDENCHKSHSYENTFSHAIKVAAKWPLSSSVYRCFIAKKYGVPTRTGLPGSPAKPRLLGNPDLSNPVPHNLTTPASLG